MNNFTLRGLDVSDEFLTLKNNILNKPYGNHSGANLLRREDIFFVKTREVRCLDHWFYTGVIRRSYKFGSKRWYGSVGVCN